MTISIEKLKKYWTAEADDALRVADHLIEKGDYSYALFFGHLALEKLLKALCADICGDHAPPIHNLVRLARIAQIQIDEQTENDFITITAFNIESRYPDFKRSFRNKCTYEFSQQHILLIKRHYAWLQSLLK
ncbi:MAG: HEPN domain-containing protein [Desulfonatronovibrio sp.]